LTAIRDIYPELFDFAVRVVPDKPSDFYAVWGSSGNFVKQHISASVFQNARGVGFVL
jgi:hypothetical protein